MGNTISVDTELANFLKRYQKSKELFTIEDFGEENIEWLANLFFKDVIYSKDYNPKDERSFMGVSANIEHIPFTKKIFKEKIGI